MVYLFVTLYGFFRFADVSVPKTGQAEELATSEQNALKSYVSPNSGVVSIQQRTAKSKDETAAQSSSQTALVQRLQVSCPHVETGNTLRG